MSDQIQTDFETFDAAHPEVYRHFCQFALDMISRGYAHGSAGLIFERMRWELMLRSLDRNPVKLNNNYRSRYARKFEEDHPEHAGFFRTRKLDPHSINSTSQAA